jgi:hypothetical protein
MISIVVFNIAFKSTLQWALRSIASACLAGSEQGGAHRTLTATPHFLTKQRSKLRFDGPRMLLSEWVGPEGVAYIVGKVSRQPSIN